MNQLLSPLLTLILAYGYPIITGAIFASSFGLPLPADAILLVSGSLTVDGTLNIYILIALISATAILGDVIVYYIGRRFGTRLLTKLIPKMGISAAKMKKVESVLHAWGFWYIFITRWLLTPLGVPVNLVAGMTGYPARKFIGIAMVGEILWVSLFTSFGYIFGANWAALLDYLNGAPQVLTLLVMGVGSVLIAYHLRRR